MAKCGSSAMGASSASVRRALALTLGSIGVLLLGVLGLVAAAVWWSPLGLLALAWFVVATLCAPAFLIPLHLKWQQPSNSSVILAWVTGLTAWAVSIATLFMICIHGYGL